MAVAIRWTVVAVVLGLPIAPVDADRDAKRGYLDRDKDLKEIYPKRSRGADKVRLFEGAGGSDAPLATGKLFGGQRIVFDPGRSGTERRVGVICSESPQRLGVYVPASDLPTVVARESFVSPAPPERDPSLAVGTIPATPGIRIAGGTQVGIGAASKRHTQVRIDSSVFEASGYIATADLDPVYRPGVIKSPATYDATIAGEVPVYRSPGATPFAKIKASERPLQVTILGESKTLDRKARPVYLVALHDVGGSMVLTGWVASEAVTRLPEPKPWMSLGIGGGGGTGGGPPSRTVQLPAGTLLQGPSGATIGVVTKDHAYACKRNCTGASPLIDVYACGAYLELRAEPPPKKSKR